MPPGTVFHRIRHCLFWRLLFCTDWAGVLPFCPATEVLFSGFCVFFSWVTRLFGSVFAPVPSWQKNTWEVGFLRLKMLKMLLNDTELVVWLGIELWIGCHFPAEVWRSCSPGFYLPAWEEAQSPMCDLISSLEALVSSLHLDGFLFVGQVMGWFYSAGSFPSVNSYWFLKHLSNFFFRWGIVGLQLLC